MKDIKVLFVCLGNICRSTMAEGIFNSKIEELGLSELISSDSAGTSNYHIGDQPDHRTLNTLRNHGMDLVHYGRQIQTNDFDNFDYILAMDQSNFQDIQYLAPSEYKGLMMARQFDTLSPGGDVPDPYYGGMDGFEHVFDILDRSLEGFIEHLRKEHQI